MATKKKQEKIKIANVKILQQGNDPDCVHHEMLVVRDDGTEIGVCQKCNQKRLYKPVKSAIL